jgi:hypothetical protein
VTIRVTRVDPFANHDGRRRIVQMSKVAVSISKRNRYTSQTMSEQTGEPIETVAMDSDLLDPYDQLVNIEILGQRVEVPEKNRLLRCFQFLSLNTISYGDFCWNGDCTNCQIWYHTAGQNREHDKPALACRMEVIEGMVITSMSRFIQLDGITK